MKRGIAEHPKTKRLARALGIPLPYAVGLVEMLCNQWAPRVAIRGDVGKWPDEDIADGLGYPGDPTELVAALVKAGWLDEHPDHRLVIHDWHEHADQGVKNRLQKAGLGFVSLPTPPIPPSHPTPTGVPPESKGGSDPGCNPGRPGTGTGKGTGSGTEKAPTVAAGRDGPTRSEPEVVDDELANAAWQRFPHWRGDTLTAVVAYVWEQAKGGPPPARKLEALDAVRGRVPIMRVVRGLRKYLAEKHEKYGLEDFVAHLNDYAPAAKPPPRASPAASIPDTKPALTAEERARVRELATGWRGGTSRAQETG